MSSNKITLSAEVIKKAARELGMIEPRDEGSILAAIDDYFQTLTDGQYSPMSGEHNNASNQTEVYAIAKKHGIDPSRMMDYLNDTAIFDKFQKISVSEGMLPDYIGNRVKAKINPEGYEKFKNDAVSVVLSSIRKGENLSYIIHGISTAYSIPAKELLAAVEAETADTGGYGVQENGMKRKNRIKSVKHDGDIEGKMKGSNPIQKNLKSVNRGGRHSEKKNDYTRRNKHKGKTFEGYRVLPPIDRERYTNREHENLEGPYSNKHGKVYYYDLKAGKYYDPDTDMYLQVDDVMEGKVNDRLQESINKYVSLMEGKEVSAHQAKLMNYLDNINADYLHTGDVILLDDSVYEELIETFPEMRGLVQKLGGITESTMSGNIAGNAQPIGDMQKRRGIAEIEYERMEDGEEELDEYDRSDDTISNKKIVRQAIRDGGELVVINKMQKSQVLKYNYDTEKWYDELEDIHFTNRDLIYRMIPRNGEVYWEYN
jgi:hypothetical protein